MAPAQGQFFDHSDGTDSEEGADDDGVPPAFRSAVDALRSARLRPELEVEPTRPPKRLAPHAYAVEAAVVDGEDDLADGRLVLLHDPSGHEAWQGTFRLVTLARAELEPEMAADPLLPEVCWTWLTGALDARGLSYGEAGGTVTRAGSHYFGALGARRPATQIEIRASWTPQPPPSAAAGTPLDLAPHVEAWGELLCTAVGLPPVPEGVTVMPSRRGQRGPGH